MTGLSRGGRENPSIPKEEWEAIKALAAGVPVDSVMKFDLWLEGTAKFFGLFKGDRDHSPWIEDACRIARRLDPVNAPQPILAKALSRSEALVELEAYRTWCRQAQKTSTAVNAEVGELRQPKRDGPDAEIARLWREGKAIDVQPTPWRLLLFMWKRTSVKVEDGDLAREVWSQDEISEDSLEAAYRRANCALCDAGFSRTLGTRLGKLLWID